jgi:hypothetical protein
MSFHQSHAVIDLIDPSLLVAPAIGATVRTPALRWDCDPLDADEPEDASVTTSPRRMLRLAIAAADAGARFARQGLEQDPVAWMLTPRAVFDGMTAMDACQDLRPFRRSIALHALGLGLDADPYAIDDLLDEEAQDVKDTSAEAVLDVRTETSDAACDATLPDPMLLTCWLDVVQEGARVFAFCAVVTDRPADLVERVIGRYGRDAANADFAVGFDRSTPLAIAMISDAMADSLALAAADPASPLAVGLDIVVEQRFPDWTPTA